jgi:hypothetical protein
MTAILRRHGFDDITRWEVGRFDHEEDLAAYRQDLEGFRKLWQAGAASEDPAVRVHRERFASGTRAIAATIEWVEQAEVDVARGIRSEAEAMQVLIGQGHHRLVARKVGG